MKNENLKKYALITGGTSGIGLELAKLFAENNYHLILVARSLDALAQTKTMLTDQYAVEVLTFAQDLSKPGSAQAVYEFVKEQHIFVDILVNSAGQGEYGLFAQADLGRLLEIIQLNVAALTELTQLFLKDMLAHDKGKILQLGSIASEMPGPWQAVYHATKAFVLSLSEAIREEIADTQVSITVLEPGATDTDFFNKAGMTTSKIMDSKLSDPAKVAADGFKALMEGKDKVVSGLKNKIFVSASNILPDAAVAKQINKMQKPKE
ncbi:SDR family NAD(P)-dependent oxidoreductase [Sphingobacterium deserti]|uniref:Short-chain dehydrogenase/reductase SDR n=1 Tax=Sphingobacterium deserti TaxID=1229276 RepID=A0A0B8T5U6_9SPHI|nr:SDR family oxidoreductase [Sphingobacterium deserti]KGE12300.1 short-chain dehydrogenase/reductase SDR [Sphingobacterium deserti]